MHLVILGLFPTGNTLFDFRMPLLRLVAAPQLPAVRVGAHHISTPQTLILSRTVRCPDIMRPHPHAFVASPEI